MVVNNMDVPVTRKLSQELAIARNALSDIVSYSLTQGNTTIFIT
jgi:hypothetical protein